MKKKRFSQVISLLLMLCLLLCSIPAMASEFGDGTNTGGSPNIVPTYYLYRTPITLKKGKTVTAYILKSEKAKFKGPGKGYKWTSSNKKCISVSSSGVVTAKKKGTAVITAKKGKTVYKCKLTSEVPKWKQFISVIDLGKSYQFKISNTKQKVKWTSSNPSIVSITSGGKIHGKSVGCATITGKVSTMEFVTTVNVIKPYVQPTPAPRPSVQTYNMGQTWTVPGQWKFTINSVTEMSERNPYSSTNPAAVYLVDYTYENIGYHSSDFDGLFMSLGLYKYIDSQGYTGYTYPNSPTYYPEEIPVGAKCRAQECIGVNHKGNFKIYIDQYSDNGYSDSDKYSAIFNVTVN